MLQESLKCPVLWSSEKAKLLKRRTGEIDFLSDGQRTLFTKCFMLTLDDDFGPELWHYDG
jgi:hypothetical protein